MRKTLDSLYDIAVWIAALMLVGVLLMVLTSILGRQLNFHVPGTDAYAGYLMAGSGFMALAQTFKRNEHIRVTLLLQSSGSLMRRVLELWSLVVATVLAAVLAWYSLRLAWQSHLFNDISTSNDATPLWIPQIAMALGAVILLIAFVDELVLSIARRGAPDPRQSNQAHTE